MWNLRSSGRYRVLSLLTAMAFVGSLIVSPAVSAAPPEGKGKGNQQNQGKAKGKSGNQGKALGQSKASGAHCGKYPNRALFSLCEFATMSPSSMCARATIWPESVAVLLSNYL